MSINELEMKCRELRQLQALIDEAQGESVNGFINRAIDETMERDNAAPAASEGQREGE